MQNWSGACAYEILSKDEKNENSFSMSNFINRKNEISHSTWYSKWMDECIARTIVQYRKWIFLCLFLAKSIFLGSREKYRKKSEDILLVAVTLYNNISTFRVAELIAFSPRKMFPAPPALMHKLTTFSSSIPEAKENSQFSLLLVRREAIKSSHNGIRIFIAQL